MPGAFQSPSHAASFPHKLAHTHGSPGLYGFSPQEMRVAIDNITVKAN